MYTALAPHSALGALTGAITGALTGTLTSALRVPPSPQLCRDVFHAIALPGIIDHTLRVLQLGLQL